MNFGRELLFFFSALGAFNGLVIGVYFLFFAKPKHRSNYFLGLLLLALSIRIGKSVFLFFNDYNLSGPFIQFGLSACLFIGPSIYFYLKSIVQPDRKLFWKWHYFPLLVIILTIDYLYPWYEYRELWRLFFRGIYCIWFVYLVISAIIIRGSIKLLFRSPIKLSAMEVWILNVFAGNLIIWIAYSTSNYTSYIVGALSFSFIFYLLVLLLIFSKRKDPTFLNRRIKYANKKIESEKADHLLDDLTSLMQEQKLFTDPNLTLSDLSKKLHIQPHTLSQYLNDNLNKNFALYINEFRIAEAKKLIEQDKHLKLESIGYACGFNSRSTFYSAFKKIEGTTPARYKDSMS